MQKKSKHANLVKPSFGSFGRNEWAFIGAPCGEIKSLVERIAELAENQILYIDETHHKEATPEKLAITTKMGQAQSFSQPKSWNKPGNYINFSHYDFCFVNGNHFTAQKQIVILDSKKEESLSKKLDRLTNVRAILTTERVAKPYDFLKDHLNDIDAIPVFSIHDHQQIWEFIKNDFEVPRLKALVLAGGKSVRMGRDKGKINYHGVGQASYLYGMLSGMGFETYMSCRPEQSEQYADKNQIHDKFLDLGPFGAIASAFMTDPNAAWIVLPCDLPLLEQSHIKTLTSKRNPHLYATAFLNNHTQFPEPLISIWEPKMYQRMLGFLTQGYSCPRKVLINSEVELIEIENQDFMTNVNTPEELEKVSLKIEGN
ncbi:NTP transferase domain-containing protein [Portibacter lacus]|uniref:MobA-like NTP transferase domain-containing protein n=1 Tax=Portibacter lacus TaxID=1099794 RepID=A0AA37SMM3_9BACT|nr:NTP transferase domain-containing protein [Portibacter lacus]GLR16084.1 hypothetical protein GCM10007940_06990 [Portibacter lacus]